MEGKQVSADQVKQTIMADVDRLAAAVAEALNTARAGSIVADTEEPVRDASAVFREQMYGKVIGLLQQRQEAFSPSARKVAKQRGAGDEPPDGQRASDGT